MTFPCGPPVRDMQTAIHHVIICVCACIFCVSGPIRDMQTAVRRVTGRARSYEEGAGEEVAPGIARGRHIVVTGNEHGWVLGWDLTPIISALAITAVPEEQQPALKNNYNAQRRFMRTEAVEGEGDAGTRGGDDGGMYNRMGGGGGHGGGGGGRGDEGMQNRIGGDGGMHGRIGGGGGAGHATAVDAADGSASFGRTSVGRTSVGRASVGRTSVGGASVGGRARHAEVDEDGDRGGAPDLAAHFDDGASHHSASSVAAHTHVSRAPSAAGGALPPPPPPPPGGAAGDDCDVEMHTRTGDGGGDASFVGADSGFAAFSSYLSGASLGVGSLVQTVHGWRAHGAGIVSLVALSDPPVVMTGSNDCTVCLWSWDGRPLGRLESADGGDERSRAAWCLPVSDAERKAAESAQAVEVLEEAREAVARRTRRRRSSLAAAAEVRHDAESAPAPFPSDVAAAAAAARAARPDAVADVEERERLFGQLSGEVNWARTQAELAREEALATHNAEMEKRMARGRGGGAGARRGARRKARGKADGLESAEKTLQVCARMAVCKSEYAARAYRDAFAYAVICVSESSARMFICGSESAARMLICVSESAARLLICVSESAARRRRTCTSWSSRSASVRSASWAAPT